MRTTMMLAATALVTLAGPGAARQLPGGLGQVPIQKPVRLDPNPQKDHTCLRPDVAANTAEITRALKSGKPGQDPIEVEREVAGCVFYRVTLSSTITVEDTEVPGVTSTIKGHGSITFGLAPDNTGSGYDFTSGVRDLTAPIRWDASSVKITRPKCEVTPRPLDYTLFAFWLGVTHSPLPKVGVRISPDGDELHPIETRCKDELGRWHNGLPGKEAIFSPAWIKLHGEGKVAAPQSADQKEMIKATNALGKSGTPAPPKLSSPTGDAIDMGKLMAMDPEKLAAMAQNLNPNNPADMAKLGQLMNGVVPGAKGQLAAALDNFMFTDPGECITDVSATRTVCTISHNARKMKDRMGYGTIKAITERTTITIDKLPPRP